MAITKEGRIKSHQTALIIYQLKRKWGISAQLYKTSVGTPDFDTGDKGITRTKYELQLITTTAKFLRKFEYDIAFLAANKNFTYGGFYEPGDRFALIAGDDIPNVTIEEKDYLLINGQRFDMQRIQPVDFGVAWFLHVRHIKGVVPYAIYDRTVWDKINIEQENIDGTF